MPNIDEISFKKEKNPVINVTIGDILIEVKTYLPIVDKMNFLTDVLNDSVDELDKDEGLDFINPLKIAYSFEYYLIKYYTNLDLDHSNKFNGLLEIYDFLKFNNVIDKVVEQIPPREYTELETMTYELMGSFEKYRGSILGILSAMKERKYAEELNIDEVIGNLQNIKDNDEFGLLKDIMKNYGINMETEDKEKE